MFWLDTVYLQSLNRADSVSLLDLLRHQIANNIIYRYMTYIQSGLGSDVLKIDMIYVVF